MAERRSSHATGMAGEFYAMERLFRLGHEPALTLGNAKSIDIIVCTKHGKLKKVSVKSFCGNGKWPVGSLDLSGEKNLVFVFLRYNDFDDVKTDPDVWVMSAKDVESRKKEWFEEYAIYYSGKNAPKDLEKFRNAWVIV